MENKDSISLVESKIYTLELEKIETLQKSIQEYVRITNERKKKLEESNFLSRGFWFIKEIFSKDPRDNEVKKISEVLSIYPEDLEKNLKEVKKLLEGESEKVASFVANRQNGLENESLLRTNEEEAKQEEIPLQEQPVQIQEQEIQVPQEAISTERNTPVLLTPANEYVTSKLDGIYEEINSLKELFSEKFSNVEAKDMVKEKIAELKVLDSELFRSLKKDKTYDLKYFGEKNVNKLKKYLKGKTQNQKILTGKLANFARRLVNVLNNGQKIDNAKEAEIIGRIGTRLSEDLKSYDSKENNKNNIWNRIDEIVNLGEGLKEEINSKYKEVKDFKKLQRSVKIGNFRDHVSQSLKEKVTKLKGKISKFNSSVKQFFANVSKNIKTSSIEMKKARQQRKDQRILLKQQKKQERNQKRQEKEQKKQMKMGQKQQKKSHVSRLKSKKNKNVEVTYTLFN